VYRSVKEVGSDNKVLLCISKSYKRRKVRCFYGTFDKSGFLLSGHA
jgi:hypothetical protein